MVPRLLLLLLPAWASGAPSLEQEVAVLKARVANSLAKQNQLAATNVELRREVDGWVDVGRKVLKREARIVDAIKQTGGGATADQVSLRAAVLADLSAPEPEPKPPLALATRSAAITAQEHLPSQLVSWHLLVLILTMLATITFCWLRAPVRFSGILGMEKHLQLSELQLEGARMGFGEGYLLVQPSGGLRTRTRCAEQKEGSSVLRFDEVLAFSVKSGDGPCVFTVFRRGELQDMRIGTVSLLASDLLGCMSQGPKAPSQYFRFNVQAEASSSEHELRVAMRIRDLAGVPAAQKNSAGFCTHTKNSAHIV